MNSPVGNLPPSFTPKTHTSELGGRLQSSLPFYFSPPGSDRLRLTSSCRTFSLHGPPSNGIMSLISDGDWQSPTSTIIMGRKQVEKKDTGTGPHCVLQDTVSEIIFSLLVLCPWLKQSKQERKGSWERHQQQNYMRFVPLEKMGSVLIAHAGRSQYSYSCISCSGSYASTCKITAHGYSTTQNLSP